MEERIERYERFIREGYLAGFLLSKEYSLDGVAPAMRERMRAGQFKRVVFTGMGCSAIVSELIRGFFAAVGGDLEIHVVNDYDFTCLIPAAFVSDPATLIIISSYSGYSTEPIRAFSALKAVHDRVLLLTSGGKLAEVGAQARVSIAHWRLSGADREYPLFHVTQYFAILMDMFNELGLSRVEAQPAIRALPGQLDTDFGPKQRELARDIALRSRNANIVMLASPLWHESLLKLCKMHFNEIAMAPATRNYFHEFCHSEVATLSDPERKHSVLLFTDEAEDDYTREKQRTVIGLLTKDVRQNQRVSVSVIPMTQPSFTRKYFTALAIVQEATAALGRFYDAASRDLISEAAGNRWYHSTTIAKEAAAAP